MIGPKAAPQACDTKTMQISTGSAYSVVSPQITGYTPSFDKVEGQAAAKDVADGLVVYVTYAANTYGLNFDLGQPINEDSNYGFSAAWSEGCEPVARAVQFGQTYNYDPTLAASGSRASAYVDLPSADDIDCEYYTFTGWYLDDACTQRVDNDDGTGKYTIDNDTLGYVNEGAITLYAGWQLSSIATATITWSDLTFDLNNLVWNPKTHKYESSDFEPCDGVGSTYVQVENTGELWKILRKQ